MSKSLYLSVSVLPSPLPRPSLQGNSDQNQHVTERHEPLGAVNCKSFLVKKGTLRPQEGKDLV